MALTVAEAVEELTKLTYEREIWMDVVDYLSKCAPAGSSSGEITSFITVRQGGHKVPPATVKEVLDCINKEKVDPLNEAIDELENMNVSEETNDEDPDKTSKRKTNTSPIKPKAGKVRKGISAIARPTGPKAKSSG